MTRVGELPELIDKIVETVVEPTKTPLQLHFLAYGPNSHWDIYPGNVYFPRKILHPFLLVNRTWHGVVERHLYRSVGIGGELQLRLPGEFPSLNRDHKTDEPDTKQARCICLFRTLEHDTYLASVVRELHLRSVCGGDEMTTNIRLIGLCPNVRCIDFFGWNSPSIPRLMDALRGVRQLEVLILNGGGAGPLWYLMEELFYHIIIFWPNLTTFVTRSGVCSNSLRDWEPRDDTEVDEDSEGREAVSWRAAGAEEGGPSSKEFVPLSDYTLRHIMSSPPLSSCSHLQYFCLDIPDCIPARHLRALSRIAPRMKDFQAQLHLEGNSETEREDVCEALRTWAPTLETASVSSNDVPTFEPISDKSLMEQLCSLHTLHIDSGIISLSTLAYAPVLERFTCWLESRDSDAFIRALPNYRRLKEVEVHRLRRSASRVAQYKPVLAALKLLRATRGLSYTFPGAS